MDDGLLRRLANICKDHYTITTIDDMFIYAGAKPEWKVDDTQTPEEPNSPFSHYSQRVRRFYSWIVGIRKNDNNQLETICANVISNMRGNAEIKAAMQADLKLDAELLNNQITHKGIDLEPLLATLARSLKSDGLDTELAILVSAEAKLNWTENPGYTDADCYRLVLSLPFTIYDQVKNKIEIYEETIYEHTWPLLTAIEEEKIIRVLIACKLLQDDKWRDKALAWVTGENVNNQGRVRSDNVATRNCEGLLFRSEPEIFLYKALKKLGVSFAPLPVFVRGGQTYKRIEPDFVILKDGITAIVEVDGDTFHRESPAEAQDRTTMLEDEGARMFHIQASKCDTQEKADAIAGMVLTRMAKLKDAM